MRFFISSDISKNKPLYYAVLFFFLFALLFWFASWIHFYSKYGFSQESLLRYFFMDPEFPERISLAQISEDLHVGAFLHSIMLITLFSLLNLSPWKQSLKSSLIIGTSLFMLFYLLSDFTIIYLGVGFVLLKLISFCLYQTAYLLVLLLGFLGIFKRDKKPRLNILNRIVLFFSIFSLFFIASNLLNFYTKMGFGPQGVGDYFLGNPKLFVKGKSFEGVFKIFYPHLLAMTIYSLIIAHLLPFAGLSKKRSLLLGLSLFVLSFFENLSSLLLLYVGSSFVYFKLLGFWLLQISLLFASFVLLRASLKKDVYPSLYL
ncbi:MAG: hypothetical protein ACK4OF_07345 [Aquificaceae bacterium]